MHHCKYGGSTAKRTLSCPRWHSLAEEAPKPKTSRAAALGNALHDIIEACLLDADLDPYYFVDKTVKNVLITRDNIRFKILPAIEAFEQLMDEHDIDKYWTEIFADIDEDIGGTADLLGLSADGKTLVVGDYKSGDGIMVEPEENEQALFYAMCMFLDRKERFKEAFKHVEKVVVAIVQPTDRKPAVLEQWVTTPERVDEFTDAYFTAVELADVGTTEPSAGDHCTFCPAHAFCPAKKELVEVLDGPQPLTLKMAELSEALSIASQLETWIKAVRQTAHEQLEKGEKVEGYKLVPKRASRVWTNTEEVMQKVSALRKIKKDDAVDTKLKSPAQLEKLCTEHDVDYDKVFAPFVTMVSSGNTLAKATDPRAEVVIDDVRKQIEQRFAV